MTPADLIAWRKARDRSQREAAADLDLGRRQIQKYEAGEAPIPLTVALACAALAAGLAPYASAADAHRDGAA